MIGAHIKVKTQQKDIQGEDAKNEMRAELPQKVRWESEHTRLTLYKPCARALVSTLGLPS